MIIHVIQPGETAYSIAALYGISVEWLIRENGIANPAIPVVGNTYVILFPEETYTIKEGDTLESIADSFNVIVMDLLRNNTYLADQEFLTPGDTLVISYKDTKVGQISVNGYAYPFIDLNTLRKTLPFLTYLTIFSYTINENGELVDIDDVEVIQIAKAYGVAPIMLLNFKDMVSGGEDDYKIQILTNMEVQNQFIDRIIGIIESKGYVGLNTDTPYILPQYRQNYIDFFSNLAMRLKERGLLIFNTLSPSSFELLSGFLYSGQEIVNLSRVVDGTLLLTYEFGSILDIPTAIIGFSTMEQLVQTITSQIPSEELQFGISTIGYRWELPYQVCITRGNAVSNTFAVQIARDNDVAIQYDTITQSAYFGYEEFGREYFLRHKDARSMDAYIQLSIRNNIYGIAILNIMEYFYDLWMIVNGQYEIVKIT